MILRTGSAGAGKTASVVDGILERKVAAPWGRVWVILPTELQVNAFRERLFSQASAADMPVFFGVQHFTFYELYSQLLDWMCLPQRQVKTSTVYRILRSQVMALSREDQLRYFTPIVDKPGLIELLARFIYELKQAHVNPADFSAFAAQTGRAKDADLALIYAGYQDWIRRKGAADREGAGWLALDNLQENSSWLKAIDLLVVDGFMQFSPLQTRLLHMLADGVQHTIITLTYEDQRAMTAHRAFAKTLTRFSKYGLDWQHQPMPQAPDTARSSALQHLERFFLDPEAHPVPAQDAVHLIEAPDTSSEVQGVLRRVKSLLLEGHSPEDFIILARNIDDYADLLRAVGNAYGVPLVFRQGTRLSNNPAIVALMNLLGLHNRITDFRRQSVLDVLRSPYFTINDWQPHMTSQLEQISLRFQVIGSREDWFTALENASQIPEDEDGEPLLPPDEAIEIQEMAQGLANFFDRITPPAEGTVNDFIAWMEALMGADPSYQREASADVGAILPEPRLDDLAFFATVRGPALDTQSSYIEQLVLVRDLYALHGLRGCLQDILTGYQILGDDERLISWDQFWIDLQLGIEQRHAEPMGGSYRHGRVLATSAEQGQGLPHDHVFILGLAEGVFPVQRREDPLYSDQERRQFEEITANQYDLQTTLEYQDDTAIFYQCLALARQSVTLSRPILDQNANPWPESILWRAVEDLIEDLVRLRYRVAEPLPINQAATIREVGIALAHASRDGGAAPDRLAHIHDWLLSHPDFGAHWTSVQHGQSIELARLDRRQPHGRYTGVITDQNLQRQVARILGKQRPWSASQFNDFGYCPFRFFAGRLLKLEAQEEPEPGYDPAQLGSLQHFILENTYHEIQQRDLAIHPDNATQALSILKSQADQALPTAPYAFGFRADLWWRQEQAEIRQRLEQLVALDFSAEKNSPFNRNPYSRKPYPVSDITHGQPRYIYALEAPFDRKTEPYAVLQGAAGPLLARGFIDRIDRVGDQLIVIDYKSGSQLPSERDIEEGRNFQMMLYLVAAQQIVARRDPNLQVAAGMFWSIRKPEKSTQIDANDPILGEVQARLHEMVLAGRQGDFRVQPNKFENGKCFKYCEFSQLCRIQQTPRRYI